MKKLIIALTVFSFAFCANSFAQVKVPSLITTSLESNFANAKEASWSKVSDFYRADFSINQQNISAYFDTDGGLIATGRDITVTQLPIALLLELKSTYKDYTVSNSVEVDMYDEATYYLTIESATRVMQIKSTYYGKWEIYDKGHSIKLI